LKVGIRTPSLTKRFAARTSWRRYARHSLGIKMPRGYGWITNPKRAAYNRVYNRTSISVDRLAKLAVGNRGVSIDDVASTIVQVVTAPVVFVRWLWRLLHR
jgi:hypothetical protein